jgi:hypothetical protein
MPAMAAVSVLLVVVAVAVSGGGDETPAQAAFSSSVPVEASLVESTLTVPSSIVPPVAIDTTAVAKTALDRTLVPGLLGDDVVALQRRLTELGFVPGVDDGFFGDQTRQAVWAFEKLILGTPRSEATGKVTNEMWQTMQDGIVIGPRRPGAGTHMEIYLPEQVAAVFTDDKPTLVMHISSGTGEEWCETVSLDTDAEGNKLEVPEEKAVCGVSKTPGGVFRFKRQVIGDRVGALGRMFNPVYFNYGIAVHGAKQVPLEPASHGCIRIHQTISDTFQSYINLRDYVYVWGEDGKQPENYSRKEMTPVFNYPDPDATTTTSTTTTVKTTTTTAKPGAVTTTTSNKPVSATTTTTIAKPPTAATTTTTTTAPVPTTTVAPTPTTADVG